jgi:hypothetical protein
LSRAERPYRIEYFSTPADASGVAEGREYLGEEVVTTNPQGVADLSFLLPASVQGGEFITATATDQNLPPRKLGPHNNTLPSSRLARKYLPPTSASRWRTRRTPSGSTPVRL